MAQTALARLAQATDSLSLGATASLAILSAGLVQEQESTSVRLATALKSCLAQLRPPTASTALKQGTSWEPGLAVSPAPQTALPVPQQQHSALLVLLTRTSTCQKQTRVCLVQACPPTSSTVVSANNAIPTVLVARSTRPPVRVATED